MEYNQYPPPTICSNFDLYKCTYVLDEVRDQNRRESEREREEKKKVIT